MLSGAVLKQFRTYLKSQVGHGWSVEGRKSKKFLKIKIIIRSHVILRVINVIEYLSKV